MGYRTHLILDLYKGKKTKKVGELCLEIAEIERYLNYYELGSLFFDELPNDIEEEEEIEGLYFENDGYSDDGEIPIGSLLKLLKKIEENKKEKTIKNAWYEYDFTQLINILETLLEEKIFGEEEIVEFKCY